MSATDDERREIAATVRDCWAGAVPAASDKAGSRETYQLYALSKAVGVTGRDATFADLCERLAGLIDPEGAKR